jgi:septal ring factor EnvC (AmiA/AmiB activator)
MAAQPKARSGSGQTTAELEAELKRLAADLDDVQRRLIERTSERDESEAQKAALAEVLGVINSSSGDLAPAFDAMLEKALRLRFQGRTPIKGQKVAVTAVAGTDNGLGD